MDNIQMRTDTTQLKILVVDDTPANALLLRAALTQIGHSVTSVGSGEEALQYFQADKPDVVLMDVNMPGIGGIEATRQMRALGGDHWVPIIFISALAERDDMVRGLEAGGDDYLPKPVDLTLLRAKIDAMQRIAVLEGKLRASNAELKGYRLRSEYELEMARELLEHMISESSAPLPDVELWMQPATNLSGDLTITQHYHRERDYILLADAMGHGLPAALPLMPLVQVFSGMARDGYAVPAIAREMNSRIRTLLPVGNFVAVTLVCIDRRNRILEILNAGNPPALLLDKTGDIGRKLASRHPPLGILRGDDFEALTETLQWQHAGWLTLYSDGLSDAQNGQGVNFGEAGIAAALRGSKPHQSLKEAVSAHLAGLDANDDISIATIVLNG